MVAFLFVSKIPVFWDFFIPIFAENKRWVVNKPRGISVKQIFFALVVIFSASVAYATTSLTQPCPIAGRENEVLCSSSPTICCASSSIWCIAECGGIIGPGGGDDDDDKIKCPDECPSETSWNAATLGRMAKCVKNTSSAQCVYKCVSNWYATSKTTVNGQISAGACAECPDDATCTIWSQPPICNQNRYSKKNTTDNTYTCQLCPQYTIIQDGFAPMIVNGSTSEPGAISIQECYIPNNTNSLDDTGFFTITGGDCYYSNRFTG